jgi:uncharacterized protein YkwD
MTITRTHQLVISTLLLAVTAACGGGGSSSGSSDSGSHNASGSSSDSSATAGNTAITLVPAATTAIAAYTPTGDVAQDNLNWLNNVREALNLNLLTSNPAVAQAAQNHANYLVANDLSGHYETAGQTDFTGVDPWTRVIALYSTNTVGEVAESWSGSFTGTDASVASVESLFDAPFHRALMLGDFSVAGSGYVTGLLSGSLPYSATVVDFTTTANALGSNQFVVYPYSGQQGAQYEWTANESPNPFNNNTSYIGELVGYPVTIQGQIADALIISAFTISTGGTNVPCEEVDPSTANIGSELEGAAMCVPYQPLQPATQYTANVIGTKNGQAFNLSWSWTTQVAAVSAKALNPGQGVGKPVKPQID